MATDPIDPKEFSEDFNDEVCLELLDASEDERFSYLVAHFAFAGCGIVARKGGELLPLKKNGAWVVTLWPRENVARICASVLPTELQPDAFEMITCDHILNDLIPEMIKHKEVFDAFPDRKFFGPTYFAEYLRTCIEYELENKSLAQKAARGNLSPDDEAELARRFMPQRR